MADEKDDGIPDPWAGLDGEGEGDAKEEFAFSFDGLDEDFAADGVADSSDEAAAEVDDIVESVREGSSPGLEAMAAEAEAVVEDDIAGWLEEPAASANAFAGGGDISDADVPPDEPDAELEEVVAELDGGEVDLEPAAVLAIGGAAATMAAVKPKAKKKSGPGFLGPILGGLLSLPIVFLILLGVLWGTGRDPIGMRSWLPSVMLPARQAGRTLAAADGKQPSLDDLAAAETETATGETPAAEPGMPEPQAPALPALEISPEPVPLVGDPSLPTIEPPPIDDSLLAAVPGVRPVPEPAAAPPLDLSGIETAVDTALASMDRVGESAAGPPAERRRALVAWYKELARVGTELAMLETAAADAGRPLDEIPAAITTLYERLGSATGLAPDLKRLCRNWVDYAKRPADGVLLVGMLEAARQVGPFWYTTLTLEQVDGSLRTVSLISRREPRAEPGDRVAVAGVVFSEDTVWAADCGRLAASAAVEDDPF